MNTDDRPRYQRLFDELIANVEAGLTTDTVAILRGLCIVASELDDLNTGMASLTDDSSYIKYVAEHAESIDSKIAGNLSDWIKAIAEREESL